MMLSPHFSFDEFTASETAARMGIDNTIPRELELYAINTANMLERIREALSAAAGKQVRINVTSGYRCLSLNRQIGSSDTSDHVRAQAADIKAPDFGSAYKLAKFLADRIEMLGIGQVIYEYQAWVHVSTRRPTKDVNRILTIGKAGTFPGILEA